MAGTLFLPPRAQSIDSTGTPRSGALLYLYASGTSTAITAYTDSALTSEHTSPIEASSAGVWPPIYLDPSVTSVKAVIKTAAGVQIYSDDAVTIPITQLVIAQDASEASAGITPSDYSQPIGSVARYGAVADGATDDTDAFDAAWSVVKLRGGELLIPPGTYMLDSTWTLDATSANRENIQVRGYGAELLSGSSVTGHAIVVSHVAINFFLTIEGLHINHRGNATASGGIKLLGAQNARVVRCIVEAHDTKAGYSAFEAGPTTAGDNDTNSFWVVFDGCSTRKRAGADGDDMENGIILRGSVNAAKIVNCQIANCTNGVVITTDGTGLALANSVRVLYNDFETVGTAILVAGSTDTAAEYFLTGCTFAFNRVESATTFFEITGDARLDHSFPPILQNNYLTVGSVTTYLTNPNDQYIYTLEPNYFADQGQTNWIGGPSNFTVVTQGTGKNFQVQTITGTGGSYDQAHLVLGPYHIWVEASNGKLRIKNSAPTTDDDGTVVGTQS